MSTELPELLSKVLVVAAVQATLGNLELNTRLFLNKFAVTQDDVDAFIDSIHGYMLIGSVWGVGTSMIMYQMHEIRGAIINAIVQLAAMLWIIIRRYNVVKDNARKYNLHIPSIF